MTTDQELEDLIWYKQSLMRVMAWLSFQHDGVIDHLCAMLNDVESSEEADLEAIGHFIKAVECYKQEKE